MPCGVHVAHRLELVRGLRGGSCDYLGCPARDEHRFALLAGADDDCGGGTLAKLVLRVLATAVFLNFVQCTAKYLLANPGALPNLAANVKRGVVAAVAYLANVLRFHGLRRADADADKRPSAAAAAATADYFDIYREPPYWRQWFIL